MASPHAPGSPAGHARQAAASIRAWQVWTLRPPARVYVVGLVVLDLAVTLTALAMTGRVSLAHFGLYIALLGCGVVLIEVIRTVGEPKGTDTHDLLGVWFLPIAALFPPGYAFLAPLLVGGYSMVRVRRAFPHRRVFNDRVPRRAGLDRGTRAAVRGAYRHLVGAGRRVRRPGMGH
jgi:hypothetical protein